MRHGGLSGIRLCWNGLSGIACAMAACPTARQTDPCASPQAGPGLSGTGLSGTGAKREQAKWDGAKWDEAKRDSKGYGCSLVHAAPRPALPARAASTPALGLNGLTPPDLYLSWLHSCRPTAHICNGTERFFLPHLCRDRRLRCRSIGASQPPPMGTHRVLTGYSGESRPPAHRRAPARARLASPMGLLHSSPWHWPAGSERACHRITRTRAPVGACRRPWLAAVALALEGPMGESAENRRRFSHSANA